MLGYPIEKWAEFMDEDANPYSICIPGRSGLGSLAFPHLSPVLAEQNSAPLFPSPYGDGSTMCLGAANRLT